ncbi:MAG: hypothetical protein L3J51_03770 [Cocleimonas sp.]|nr:hypothetical protein [Cocleimonas sp.]
MFALSRSEPKKIKDGKCVKASPLIESCSTVERRKTRRERRFPLERRKAFSSLSTSIDKRENNLEQRRNDIDRREIEKHSKTVVDKVNKLELNATSIDSLINDQMLIVKKITKLLPIKKGVDFSQIETNISQIYADIKSLMQKEEYLLCLYLETNNGKMRKEDVDNLLSIISTDISRLSDELMQFVKIYYTAKINQTNIGFVQLDMNIIRKKIILCLYKKKKHLYPIYIT